MATCMACSRYLNNDIASNKKKLKNQQGNNPKKLRCTPSQLALAWVHHQVKDVCPILETTKLKKFEENIGGLSVKLTTKELGWNLETGLERTLSSWKSVDDPTEGEYIVKMGLRGYPQIMNFKGPNLESRVGSWNGLSVVGYPGPVLATPQKFEINEKEVYYEFEVLARSVFIILALVPTVIGQNLFWTA
ncbi:hypothetical protein JHK84_034135 [Glycine max]|nr:hypothetical protein JHK86_033877 [Glycine max]KAG5140367.1 hypothetical protein JHK84_034135 [Glycine max]